MRKLWKETAEKYFLKSADVASLKKLVNLDSVLEILKKEKIVQPKATWETIEFYKPKSAPDIPDGYKGRIGIYEVLDVTEPVRNLIEKNATADEIERYARESQGMVSMLEDGFVKAVQGVTSIEEVLRATQE